MTLTRNPSPGPEFTRYLISHFEFVRLSNDRPSFWRYLKRFVFCIQILLRFFDNVKQIIQFALKKNFSLWRILCLFPHTLFLPYTAAPHFPVGTDSAMFALTMNNVGFMCNCNEINLFLLTGWTFRYKVSCNWFEF